MGHIGYLVWIGGWAWAANKIAAEHPVLAIGAIVLAVLGATLWIEQLPLIGRRGDPPRPPES